MSVICLSGAGVTIKLATAITLMWTHSVQKSSWAEDWQATPEGLTITEMRIQGSGAGMEPPADAVRVGDYYVSHPEMAPLHRAILRRSGATADWQVCRESGCQPMSDLLPPAADPVELSICR